MDVGSLRSSVTLEAIVAAWSEALTAEAGAEHGVPGSPLAQAATAPLPITAAGFVEGAVDSKHAGAAAAPPHAPGTRIEHGPETATRQSFARQHAPMAEPQRPVETALPTAAHAHSEFAIPAAQLLPVSLVGLQVEPAAGWPFPQQRGFDMLRPEPVRAPAAEPPPVPDAEVEPDADAAERQAGAHEDESETALDGVVFDEPDTNDWCEPLTRALRAALASKPLPQALLVAADQWQRGRCVVLACPQGEDPAGPAWAFVLWPRPRSRAVLRNEAARHRAPLLALFGLRVEARLQWSAPPRRAHWCHVRLVKEHHPRRGRQLVSPERDDGAVGPKAVVPCEVQLGPVLVRSLRWCEVCVRINAVRRFWAALGGQWSVNVLVSVLPLAGSREPAIVEAAC